MPDLFNIYAILLQIVCSIATAVCSYLLLNWTHLRVLLQLDARLSEVEGRVNREIKIRASEASHRSRTWEKELINQTVEAAKEPQLTLESWRKNKFGAR